MWLKKKRQRSSFCHFSDSPVLPVVILIIEGAPFQNLKVARAENGIVNEGSGRLEPRRLREALILGGRLLLVARRVAPGQLLARLVLEIQLYCLVTTLWVVYWTEQPSLEVDSGTIFTKFYSNDKVFPPGCLTLDV